jgi:hypothetical protein
MKKLSFIAILFFAVSATMVAQSNKEEVDFYQSLFGMEKKAIVAGFVKVDDASSEAFWTLYDQYESERKALGQKRIELLQKYVESYDQMSDEKIDELVAEMIKLKSSTDKLINTYYKKVKTASGSRAAAQFFQIENYFVSAIRLSIYESIPFIGELED